MSLHAKLSEIQKKLVAPKSNFNSFGKYNYRSCEDIMLAVKPHLDGLALTISDIVEMVGDRYYVKATATLTDCETLETFSVSASAREEESKKGMDGSQVTGASSSYARKYALNGLFAIDDNKDSDATNKHGKEDTPVKGIETATLITRIAQAGQLLKPEQKKTIMAQFGSKKIDQLTAEQLEKLHKDIQEVASQ